MDDSLMMRGNIIKSVFNIDSYQTNLVNEQFNKNEQEKPELRLNFDQILLPWRLEYKEKESKNM